MFCFGHSANTENKLKGGKLMGVASGSYTSRCTQNAYTVANRFFGKKTETVHGIVT